MNYRHPDWSGKTVFILGGGESLRDFDPAPLREHKVIAVNEAGLTLCPWADILFWADIRWVQWNMKRLPLHTGEFRYTCQNYGLEEIPRARLLRFTPTTPDSGCAFAFKCDTVAGLDSGGRCINLAYHTRAARVVLLGFDMRDYPQDRWRDGNFHTAHPEPPLAAQRTAEFIPAHEIIAARLRELVGGFEVLNATPGSALACWPKVNLEDVL